MGFFWDPNSQIPNPGDLGFFPPKNPEAKIPKNPKSPGLGFFFEQNPKIPKIYYKNKTAELMIVVFLRRKTKNPFFRKVPEKLEKSEKNP